jgi:hypothetical protein
MGLRKILLAFRAVIELTHVARLNRVALMRLYPLTTTEKLWKNTQKKATHLKYFKAFDELRVSVLKTFHKYLEDATQVICVMRRSYARRPVLHDQIAHWG